MGEGRSAWENGHAGNPSRCNPPVVRSDSVNVCALVRLTSSIADVLRFSYNLRHPMSPLASRSSPSRLLPFVLAPLALLLTGCGGPDLIERLQQPQWGLCGTLIVVLDIVALIDLLGGDDYEAAGKVLWALLIVFFPILGVLLYFFFGRD